MPFDDIIILVSNSHTAILADYAINILLQSLFHFSNISKCRRRRLRSVDA